MSVRTTPPMPPIDTLPAGRALDRAIAEQWVGLHVFDLPVADDPERGFPEPMVDSPEELRAADSPPWVDAITPEYAEQWPLEQSKRLARIKEDLAAHHWNARIEPCYHDVVGQDGAPCHAVPIPDYSTVDAAALELLAAWPDLVELRRLYGRWRCALGEVKPMRGPAGRLWQTDAETLPLAICRCVLLAAQDGVRPKA